MKEEVFDEVGKVRKVAKRRGRSGVKELVNSLGPYPRH